MVIPPDQCIRHQRGTGMFDARQYKLFQDALTLHQQSKLDQAARIYRDLLAAHPDHPDLLQLLGVLNYQRGNFADAIALMQKSLACVPNQPIVHVNLGNAWHAFGRNEEALASYARALALQPDLADAYYNKASLQQQMMHFDAAMASYNEAVRLKPDFVGALLNRGNLHKDLRQYDAALADYYRVLNLNPKSADAHNNIGSVYDECGETAQAVMYYQQAIVLKPDFGAAYLNLAGALRKQRRHAEALAAYRRAAELNPGADFLAGNVLHAKQFLCEWSDLAGETARVIAAVERGEKAAVPFVLLATAATPAVQRKCAEIYARLPFARAAVRPYVHDKIRIGYFSADFLDHATTHLLTGMLERHDRNKFEIFGFCWSPDDGSEMRHRTVAAFDRFIDVESKRDAEIAAFARALEIDIAVDLKGFTGGARPAIFAHGAAPVQASYLGYPGTMAADYIDYLIADPVLIPPEQRPYYRECIVTLPDTYQVNDAKRPYPANIPTRRAVGLPDESLVYCSFNNTFKITPAVFDIWMRLLRDVPASVLWLLETDPAAAENLRREAAARGISAERLVFAPRVPLAAHLARHVHADIVLDTFFYNGHTTTSDALWMGVPVVTWAGDTFAGRVSASLLKAAGLPACIAPTWQAYEALAFDLATDAQKRGVLKARLAANRSTSALFDTARFTRHIEVAYQQMEHRAQDGLPPADFAVTPIGS